MEPLKCLTFILLSLLLTSCVLPIKENSCLLINALTKNNERVSLYIAYVYQKKWLINYLNVEYLGEQEQYLKTPICDVDALMKKRMEAWEK